MTATTQDRNTSMRDGELFAFQVAAGVRILAGTIVCANAAGFAVPGAATAGLVMLGRAEESVDNTAGADGAAPVLVRRRKAFQWANASADPVVQATVGRPCYVADNQSVTASNTGGVVAGTVIGLDANGVWVQ